MAEVDRTVTAEVIYYLLRWPDPPAEEPPRRPNLFWPPDPLPCDKSENSHIRHKPDIPAQPVRVHKSPRPGLGLRNYRKAA